MKTEEDKNKELSKKRNEIKRATEIIDKLKKDLLKKKYEADGDIAYLCIGGDNNNKLVWMPNELEENYRVFIPTKPLKTFTSENDFDTLNKDEYYYAGVLSLRNNRCVKEHRVLYNESFKTTDENLGMWCEFNKPSLFQVFINK